jgi:hypothetical protein
MRNSLSVTIRSADQTRKAAVKLPLTLKVEQLISEIQNRWNLPSNVSYAMRLERTGQQLNSSIILMELEIEENDILDIYPILEAG